MRPLTLKILKEAYDLRTPDERRNQREKAIMRATGNLTAAGKLDGSSEEGRIRHGRALSRAYRSHALDTGQPYYADMTVPTDIRVPTPATASPQRMRSIQARRARLKAMRP